jgi:hypothetical protein
VFPPRITVKRKTAVGPRSCPLLSRTPIPGRTMIGDEDGVHSDLRSVCRAGVFSGTRNVLEGSGR